jgi:hypothetical protein
VYNLQVEGDHCYRVGRQGLLVHNQSPGQTGGTPNAGQAQAPPCGCTVTKVRLVTSRGNAPGNITFNDVLLRPWQFADLGPYNNSNNMGSYAYVYWVVFEGTGLDDCTFGRWVRATLSSTNPQANPRFITTYGRGYQQGQLAAESADKDDLLTGIGIERSNTLVVMADAPGVQGLSPSELMYSFLASYYAFAKSKSDSSKKGEIWYDLTIRIATFSPGGVVNTVTLIRSMP